MKRYVVTGVIGTGSAADPLRPAVSPGTSYVLVGSGAGRALVKVAVPDGAARTPETIVDVAPTGDEVLAVALPAAQRTALKTVLAGLGCDVAGFDGAGLTDRAKLWRYLLGLFGESDERRALVGCDVSEG